MNTLPHFSGGGQMYWHNTFFGKLLLTEGVNYVREKTQARWLFDLIQSYQNKLKGESFQSWTLERVSDMTFLISCSDGNGNRLAQQKIPYSDFPLFGIVVWVVDNKVCLLPKEY